MGYNDRQYAQQGYGQAPQGYAQPQYAAGGDADFVESQFSGAMGDAAVIAFTKRVYAYFTGALMTATAACVGGMYAVDGLMAAGQRTALTGLAVASTIGFFVSYLVVVLMRKNHSPMKVALLFVFASCAGFMTTPLVGAFLNAGMGMTVVAAFGITSVTFFGLTVYTLSSGRDFRSLGGMLTVGLLVLIGLILLNIFIPFSGPIHRLIVIGGIVLFIGFILYDTSMVTRNYFHSNDAVSAAIQLFYDFFILFRYVLLLLGDRR
jgi:FtsH-binding integral membrane protein